MENLQKLKGALPIGLLLVAVIVIVLREPILEDPKAPGVLKADAGEGIETSQRRTIHESSELPWTSLEEWHVSAMAMGNLTSSSVIEEGRRLADLRAARLKVLIREDPDAAIRAMLPLAVYANLPQEIRERIEQPFAASADVVVIPTCRAPKALGPSSKDPGNLYFATWDGERRQVFLPRSRRGLLSKQGASLAGVVLGDVAVVMPSPVWTLSETDAEVAPDVLGVSELEGIQESAAHVAVIGSELLSLSLSEQQEYARVLRLAETLPGSDTVVAATAAVAAGGESPFESGALAATAAAASWTQSPKDVLMIRVQFSDVSLTVTQSQVEAKLAETSALISEQSYGQTFLENQDVTSVVYTLPHDRSYYLSFTEDHDAYDIIRADGLSAARAAGLSTAGYDVVGVLFPPIALGSGGLASVGGGGGPFGGQLWISGHQSTFVYLHEFGHLYGLQHASAWLVDDGSTVPCPVEEEDLSVEAPKHEEYGDIFDPMGTGPAESHFSAFGKERIEWIPSDRIQTITANGESTHRIYRFDHSGALANTKLALKVQRAQSETFWISYRAGLPAGSNYDAMRSSANVLWEFASDRARLVDTTPDSNSDSIIDRWDAGVAIGETFTDPKGLVTINPTAIGGTGVGQWMDVTVTLGAPGNLPPQGIVSGPTEGLARTPYSFSVNANDPDGDAISYRWHLGNDIVINGGPTIEHAFPLAVPEFQVEMDDGRGGITFLTHAISMAEDPLLNWEEVNTDEDVEELVYAKGRFVMVGDEVIMESLDGEDWEEFDNDLDGHCIAFAEDTFLVGGRQEKSDGDRYPTLFSSQDGREWADEPIPEGPVHALVTSIAYGNGIWLAATSRNHLYHKASGGPWESREFVLRSPKLTFGGGYFFARQTRELYRSADGVTWSEVSPDNMFEVINGNVNGLLRDSVFYDGNLYAANSRTGMWRANNVGEGWVNTPYSDPSLWTEDTAMVMTAPGFLLAAGSRFHSGETRYEYYVSVDGQVWGAASHAFARWLWTDGTYGFGRIITIANRQILATGFLDMENRAPEASVLGSPSGIVNVPTTLSVSESDPDGDDLFHLWDFGDGNEAWGGAEISHVYSAVGDYDVTVKVTDGRGGLIEVNGSATIGGIPDSGANEDGDDWPDLIEYAAGSSMFSAASTPVLRTTIVRDSDQDWIEFVIPRLESATGVTVIPEVSEDMEGWRFGDGEFTIRESAPGEMIVRDRKPFNDLEQRFYRIRVVLE